MWGRYSGVIVNLTYCMPFLHFSTIFFTMLDGRVHIIFYTVLFLFSFHDTISTLIKISFIECERKNINKE